MNEPTETSLWECVLADVRSVEPSDFWETAKLLSGITALKMIDKITEEQAEYARAIFSERSRDAKPVEFEPSDEKQGRELWALVLRQAESAVEEDDGWERLKILIGLAQLLGFGIINQEQVDHVRRMLGGGDDDVV